MRAVRVHEYGGTAVLRVDSVGNHDTERRCDLEDVPEGHGTVEDEHVLGKLVVVPETDDAP